MKGEQAFREDIRHLMEVLEENKRFFDVGYRDQIEGAVDRLDKVLAQNEADAKILRIGVVGAMKAGKSTFLNMLLFDGKDVLPHAASPMTAALTRIRYSDDGANHATVHFYEQADWERIERKAEEYDAALDSAYEAHVEEIKRDNERQRQLVSSTASPPPPPRRPMSRQQFEVKFRGRPDKVGEYQVAAKELVTEFHEELRDLLGKDAVLDGTELSTLLGDYVGSGGKYTPIVNYVELAVPIESLEGCEIVDMPGLGDPVVSRSEKTKEFVKDCDVVLYFSRGNQFMEGVDVQRLARMLPSAGVKDGVVICSRFDALVTGYRGKFNLHEAIRKSQNDARCAYEAGLAKMPNGLRTAFAAHGLVFSSAASYGINRKQRAGQPLTEDEKVTYDLLKKMNQGRDLTPAQLVALSGLNEVRKVLNAIADKKETLLKGSRERKVTAACEEVKRVLRDLIGAVQNETEALEGGDIEALKKKRKSLERGLDRASEHIGSHFTVAALTAKKKIEGVSTELMGVASQYVSVKVETKSEHRSERRSEGFWGWRKTYYDYEVTTYSLDTSQIDNNVLSYASQCAKRVNEVFELVVDTNGLRRSVTDEMLAALQDAAYSEEDILSPLRIAFAQIKLPGLKLDPNAYLDRVHAEFPEGVAKGNDIHRARELMTAVLVSVQQDIDAKLAKSSENIVNILNSQASGFTTEMRARMCGELDRLEGECRDKEKNVALREEFIRALHGIQESVSK